MDTNFKLESDVMMAFSLSSTSVDALKAYIMDIKDIQMKEFSAAWLITGDKLDTQP